MPGSRHLVSPQRRDPYHDKRYIHQGFGGPRELVARQSLILRTRQSNLSSRINYILSNSRCLRQLFVEFEDISI